MKRLITALGFTLLASPAFAKTTVSTSLVFVPAGRIAVCNFVVNASKPLTVLMSVNGFDGTVFDSETITIAPGQGTSFGPVLDNQLVYYAFEFSGGSSKSIRGSVSVIDATENTITSLPAS